MPRAASTFSAVLAPALPLSQRKDRFEFMLFTVGKLIAIKLMAGRHKHDSPSDVTVNDDKAVPAVDLGLLVLFCWSLGTMDTTLGSMRR